MNKLILILVLPLFAADVPPKIPIEHEAEYFRADGIVAHMQPAWDAANAERAAAGQAVTKDCGEKHHPQLEGKHVVCVANPEPAKESPKK